MDFSERRIKALREGDYRALKRMGLKLGIPIPEVFLELEVRSQEGKLLDHYKQRSHTWTRNAYNILFSQLAAFGLTGASFGAGFLSLKTTGGSVLGSSLFSGLSSSVGHASTVAGYRAAVATVQGIVVGTGTGAESFEDFALGSAVAEGTGAGQLSYVLQELSTGAYAALTWTVTHSRYFNNNSGGAIVIGEVGIYAYMMVAGSSTNILVTRDKLASTVSVANTAQLKVTYTIAMTWPS